MSATQSDRDRVDPLVVLAERPGPRRVPAVALPEAEVDREDEGDVEPDHRDRGADAVPDEVVPDRRDHQHGGEEADRDDGRSAARGSSPRAARAGGRARRRSRENANIIRDADVTDAVRQKNCATTQMKSRISAQFWLIDSVQIQGTTIPMFSSAPSVLGIGERDREEQDPPEERPMRRPTCTCPTAAIREAWCVSSAVCAEASKPVIVYWDSSSPRPNTNQNAGLDEVVGRAAVPRRVHRLGEDVDERLVPVGDDDAGRSR